MKRLIREEIEWIKYKDYLVTSLIIWNDKFLPFETVIFRKNSLVCRAFIKIKEVVYQEDFLVDELRTNLEEEILFSITNYLQNLVNVCTMNEYPDMKSREIDYNNPALEDIKDILKEMFLDRIVLEYLTQAVPDFGFYSLSLNFHKLKTMIEEGRKPTLYEEFTRINKKYS